MIRILFTIFACILVSSVFGQFYLQPTVGYTFSSHPKEIQTTIIVDGQKSAFTTQIKNGSGLHMSLDLGYKLKNNFFAELAVKQSIYTKQEISIKTPEVDNLTTISISGNFFGEGELSNSIFQVSPLIGYLVEQKKLGVYFKIGPNFMHVSTTQKETKESSYFWKSSTKEVVFSGKLHVGLQANLGATYQWKENLSFVLDIVNVYNNYKYTKGEITEYEIDGDDLLDTIEDPTVKPYDYNSRINFSNYGISVGLKYFFRKNVE